MERTGGVKLPALHILKELSESQLQYVVDTIAGLVRS